MLSLGASSFGDSDLPQVQFANSRGFSAKLPAISPNPLQVAVPIYINPATGKPDSGTVSLTVIYPDGTTKAVQGTLTIAAPPTLAGVAPGAITEAFLEGTINLIASSQSSLDSVTSAGPAAAALVTPAITAYLTTATTRLMTMQAAASAFLAGKPGDSIGSITTSTGSLTLRIDTATMYTSDRIIAAFLNQIAPAGQGLARRLPVTVSEAATDYLDFARTWNETLTSDISDQWLDWGKKVGSTIGTVTAVTGLAVALAASTPAIAAVGTTAAVIGAMGYAVSTFAPAVSATFLRVGSSILLNGQASQEDYMPETKFVIENTAAQGASFWLTSWVEEVDGDLSSAVVGALDDQAGITAKVGKYVAGAVDLVYPPDTEGTCVVTISPKAKTFIYSGGNGTVAVTATTGCAWTAISSVAWISVISGSSGAGNGTVGYSVQANSSTAARVGTILIADSTFTLTQAGKTGQTGTLNGNWAGTYTGVYTYSNGDTWQENDSLHLTINGTLISGLDPVYATGSVNLSSGSGSWGVPQTSSTSSSWVFTGTFSTAGTASGTWTYIIPGNGPQGGSGTGTWTAVRQ